MNGSLPHILTDRHAYGTYLVAEWNLMGFRSLRNPCNTIFKQQVVSVLYHDIFILAETHCLNQDTVEFDDYKIYQNNRKPHNPNVTKGSGGIAWAIHNSVLQCHSIVSVIKGVDGQIAMKLKSNYTELLLGIIGFYLSPDTFRYGQESEEFF